MYLRFESLLAGCLMIGKLIFLANLLQVIRKDYIQDSKKLFTDLFYFYRV
jgi:hypothetical protein